MTFPLLILVIVTIYAFLGGGNVTGGGAYANTSGEINVNGSTSTFDGGAGGIFSFDLFTGDGLLVVLLVLVAAGILLGISVFGSGLSEFSQNLVIKSVGLFGLWAALVLFSSEVITNGTGVYGVLIYFGLTLMYGVGFLSDVSGSGN